jgi:hypothetical protein
MGIERQLKAVFGDAVSEVMQVSTSFGVLAAAGTKQQAPSSRHQAAGTEQQSLSL